VPYKIGNFLANGIVSDSQKDWECSGTEMMSASQRTGISWLVEWYRLHRRTRNVLASGAISAVENNWEYLG
jgi:hypothetical protein